MDEQQYKIFTLALSALCTGLIAVYGIMRLAYE